MEPLNYQMQKHLPVTGILRHVDHLVFTDLEGILQGLEDLIRWWVFLEVMATEVLLHLTLDMEG